MRVAAILGPGASSKDLEPLQKAAPATWLAQLPANSNEADAILVLGGDGTIHRHLELLVSLQLPVLVVPRGSGNDFARAIGLGKLPDALSAWRAFTSGHSNVRAIDLGLITPRSAEAGATAAPHYFCTIAGIGLDGEIARRANRLPRWLLARGGYALSLPLALLHFKPFMLRITANDDRLPLKPAFLAAVANTPAYGGGMRIAPRALLDDGLLDLCIIRPLNKLKLLYLFPTVYSGGHLALREVEYLQATKMLLETEAPAAVYADGEPVSQTPAEFSVARNALRVIMPESGL
jgi:diacylglycerol kinase (ATP)